MKGTVVLMILKSEKIRLHFILSNESCEVSFIKINLNNYFVVKGVCKRSNIKLKC